jgi:hypothetical protein
MAMAMEEYYHLIELASFKSLLGFDTHDLPHSG